MENWLKKEPCNVFVRQVASDLNLTVEEVEEVIYSIFATIKKTIPLGIKAIRIKRFCVIHRSDFSISKRKGKPIIQDPLKL